MIPQVLVQKNGISATDWRRRPFHRRRTYGRRPSKAQVLFERLVLQGIVGGSRGSPVFFMFGARHSGSIRPSHVLAINSKGSAVAFYFRWVTLLPSLRQIEFLKDFFAFSKLLLKAFAKLFLSRNMFDQRQRPSLPDDDNFFVACEYTLDRCKKIKAT